MAGDWIKMRKSLLTDGRIVRIMSALNADICPQDVRKMSDRFRTIGGVLSVWCLFDEQTEEGKLEGYTPEILDEYVGFPGITKAMASVGWLEVGEGYVLAPEFEKHNGATAKRRAQETVRKMSARNADKCPHAMRPREEKRRENPPTPQEGVCFKGGVLEYLPRAELGRKASVLAWAEKNIPKLTEDLKVKILECSKRARAVGKDPPRLFLSLVRDGLDKNIWRIDGVDYEKH